MQSNNLIQISGHVIKDAVTNDKCSFASFSIGHKVGADIMFLNCIMFSKKADIPFDLLKSGSEVFVKGHLKPNNYQKDGVTHRGFQIVVDKIRSAKE